MIGGFPVNRVEFVQSIKRDNDTSLTDLIVNFFDQYMFLYDLVDDMDSVTIIDHNQSSISFRLDYSNAQPVEQLQEKLYAVPVAIIYGIKYSIVPYRLEDRSILITILK